MKSRHTEDTARERLIRNGAKIIDKVVHIKSPGLKLWGVIDYLAHNHKYKVKILEGERFEERNP